MRKRDKERMINFTFPEANNKQIYINKIVKYIHRQTEVERNKTD